MALNAGSIEIKLFANLARLQADMNKANKTVDTAMRSIEKSSQIARRALGGVASAFSVFSIVKLADDFKRFDAQLQLATRNLKTYTEAFDNVVRISRIAQSDIGAIGVLYSRLNNNLRDFNVTQSQVAGVTETIALALRNNNATVQETSSVMLQLSQSFGSGRLNGQEFLAVAEGAPALLRQLANSLKVPFGALKDLSAQGKLTRDQLLQAWTDPEYLAALRNQVKEVGTISSALTVFTNNLKLFVGEQDKATGASNAIRQVIMLLADNINTLATVGIAALIVATGRWVAGTMASIQASRLRQVELVREQVLLERKVMAENAAAMAMANNARAVTMAAHANSAAMTEQAAVQAAVAARLGATAGVVNTLKGALTLLGGPIGAITTALGLGLTAWMAWGNQGKISADQVAAAVDRVNRNIASINDAKLIDMQRKQLEEEKRALTERKRILEAFGKTEKDIFGMGGEGAQAMVQRQAQIEEYNRRIQELDDALAKHNTTQKENSVIITEADKAYERLVKANKVLSVEIEEQKAIMADAKQALDAKLITLADYNKIVTEAKKKINDMTGATKKLKEEEKDRLKWLKEMVKEQEEFLKAQKKAREEQIESVEKQNDAVEKEIAKLEEEIYTLKYGADAYNQLEITRLKDAAAIARQTVEQAKLNGASLDAINYAQDYIVQLERQIELKERAKTLASEKAELEQIEKVTKAQEKAADKMERSNDRIADSFSNALANAIMRGFERGKSFAYNFRDALVVAFKTVVLQPTIEFIINASGLPKLMASIFGALGMGSATGAIANVAGVAGTATTAGAATGSMGLLSDLIGGGKALFDTAVNGLQGAQNLFANSIGNFGNYIASFSNAIDNGLAYQVGTWVSNNSQFISEVIPYAGSVMKLLQGDIKGAASTAIGTAIGNAILPGIGGAIGGFLGNFVGGMFGGGKKLPRFYTVLPSSFTDGQFTAGRPTTGADSKGLLKGATDPLTQLSKNFATSLGAVLTAFGKDADMTMKALLYKKNNTIASFEANIGGQVYKVRFGGGEDVNETFSKLVREAFTKVFVQAIKGQDLGKNVEALFSGLKKQKDILETADAVINLANAQSGLVEKFGLTADQSIAVGLATTTTREELLQFLNAMSQLGQESKTVGQAILDAKANIASLFEDLGTTMPTSLTAFDSLLKNINKNTDDGIQLFTRLLELRPKFIEFENAINELKTGVDSAIFDFLTPAEQAQKSYQNLGEVFAQVNMQVPDSIESLVQMGKAIDYTTEAGLSFAAAFPRLVAAFTQAQQIAQRAVTEANARVVSTRQTLLNSYETERQRLQGIISNVADIQSRVNSAISAQTADNLARTSADLERIIDNVDVVKDKLKSAIDAERNRLEKIIDNVETFRNAIRTAYETQANGLRDTINRFKDFGKSIKDFRQSLMARLMPSSESSVASARSNFLRVAELARGGNQQAMADLFSVADNFLRTSENYSQDFNDYQNDFAKVNNILANLEGSFEGNANIAQQQLDEITAQTAEFINLNTTALSIDEAIAQFRQAQQEATVAQNEILRLNQIDNQYFGTITDKAQSIDEILAELSQAQKAADAASIELQKINNNSLLSIDENTGNMVALLAELKSAQAAAAVAQSQLDELNKKIADLALATEEQNTFDQALNDYNKAIEDQTAATKALEDATKQAALAAEAEKAKKAAEEAEAKRLADEKIAQAEAEAKSFVNNLIEVGRKVSNLSVIRNSRFGVPFADGGVFTNGIVTQPTSFNMGVMGEAGSEAIMPLTSINGRLGVSTNNSEMVNELKALNEKIARLEAASVATAQHTSKVAKIIDRADNGDSINVTVVTE